MNTAGRIFLYSFRFFLNACIVVVYLLVKIPNCIEEVVVCFAFVTMGNVEDS